MFERIKRPVYAERKNYGMVWTIAIVVFFLFWLVINENSGFFTSAKELENTAAGQYYSDLTIPDFANDSTVSQTFVSKRNSFSRIQIPFHITSAKPQGTLNLELKDYVNGKVVFTQTVYLNKLKNGRPTTFNFPKINGAKGKKYELTITASGVKKSASAAVWKSTEDHYKQGRLTINGHNVSGDLRFSIYDIHSRTLISKPMYAMTGALFLIIFILSIVLLGRYKNEMHKAFLVTGLPIGLALAIIIPPFDQLDEFDHFLRSFEVSEGMFVNQVTQHGLGNYIPGSLIDTIHKTQFINGTGYQYDIVKEAFETKLTPSNRVFFRNYASSYPPTIYIPQAIGLWVGRLFFDSPMMMMYLGRIFNLFAYVTIVYFALKIVPIKKNLFYIMALLPMSINQAATLSGDSMIISSAFLFTAYVLYMAYGNVERITLKHILATIGIGIFICVSKIVYYPIAFLFFLIPLRKFIDKKDFIKKLLLVFAGFTIPYLIWNWLNLANLSIPDVRTHAGVLPKGQISFILTHPFLYIKVLIDSFIGLGQSKFLGMLGIGISIYHYSTPDIVIYTFLFLMILFGLVNDERDLELYKYRKMDKAIIVFVMLAIILLVYTALYVGYTPVGHSIVNGVQGRYLVPVSIFMFLSISNRQVINKHKNLNFFLYTIIHCCMYVALLTYLIQINTFL
ncbi:DUF2142 domain-containing protein [Neobacillus terrae]|uniref:DUF2142 domain-containing protein n=1 Tax=Neobacillus terrae TaxID=3034837 RepID=UPI00140A6633|nr:DUF2142 domain-containing protein [Neobacillus terrae]NHM33949.1 DUF2142 domain-containing protein [Neobacillus terrae]